jgi:hypothetical protein
MWRLVAFAALLTMPAALSAQTPGTIDVPTVTVRLYRSSVRPAELRAARTVTDQILGTSGIGVVWLNCGLDREDPGPIPTACGRALGARELVLSIVPTDPTGSRDNKEALGMAAIDMVARAGTVAMVYSENVTALARAALTSPIDLLGRAMAHEIGHLLIGTNRHAARGLMRAVYSRDELRRDAPRDWMFSEPETMAMRRAIELRSVPHSASQLEQGQRR